MEIIEKLSYLLVALVFLALGSLAAFFYLQVRGGRKLQDAADKANSLLIEAREKKQQILLEATDEAMKTRAATDADYKERRDELRQAETRLTQKEEVLERKMEAVEQRDNGILAKEKDLEDLRTDIKNLKDEQVEQLEKISGMDSDEAKETLLEAVEGEISQETSRRIRAWETKLKEETNNVAQQMLSSVIQRCASDVVSEIAASVIPLPSDDMKGRLIGREGRNIRALEQATGIDLIIDDTPETVTLSGFNGVRREIARVALTKLMQDGRIHPARIEEVVGRAKTEVEAAMHIEGEQAGHKTGVHGLHPELIKLLGRLKFRTSYGQNVLMHSIEVAHLSGMIATELGTDHALARKAGLLHDVGKAVDHEVEGTHALIGADIVKQWDKSPEVAHAVGEHHGELPETSVIGYIVSAADAISASRPGARRESVELYLKRLEAVESVARGFTGVEQAYAIQAGREVRILVKPQEVDDMAALRLARDIVLKLEETLEYPGQIKVTVIRETRAVEYAK